MNVLVIGSGGREHALVWKISQSPRVNNLFCAPGNAGIARHATCVAIRASDIKSLLQFAQKQAIDLTVVGPEQPLTEGIVDQFQQAGLAIFGPSQTAAELEGSKVFAKQFMKKYGIPTAAFETFDAADQQKLEQFVNTLMPPIVVKADGLAAGKGVAVCDLRKDALQAIQSMRRSFGTAARKIVIESFLRGEELSVFALTDGRDHVLLAPAQDHKRIFENDTGKNTGGMGAYAPAPSGKPQLLEEIQRTIITPTTNGMAAEGRPYKGCLYVGLMLTKEGPKVLEYNCRFGDPEAQVVLPLIDEDIVELFLACINGSVPASVRLKQATAVCVVMASAGYPDTYEVGKRITGLDANFGKGTIIFHAGTKREEGYVLTAGGRVLGVTAITEGNNLQAAIDRAYFAVGKISFDGAYYRRDIGKKGVRRMKELQAQSLR